MNCLEIIFDNPNGYTSGEAVTGNVVLRNSETISTRFIKICIEGVARTKWKCNEHGDSDCDGEHKFYHDNVDYSGEVRYVSEEIVAWKAAKEDEKLQCGQHTFPFEFLLPADCPPSYEGIHGHIRYSVRVEFEKSWKFYKKEGEFFKVVVFSCFDPNCFSNGQIPISRKDSKDIGVIFKKGIVAMTVTIPKQAYASGELIPITIDIDNKSKRPAICIRAELQQHSHYYASRESGFFSTHSSNHDHHQVDVERVAESRKEIKIDAKSQGHEELRIAVPNLIPNFDSSIIRVDYCLLVRLDTETSLNNTLQCTLPLIIRLSSDLMN